MAVAEPPVPFNFTVTNNTDLGEYVLGHDKFSVTDQIHVVSVFSRELTPSDDFILGVLTVLLISILSEIAHSIILRSSNRTVPLVRILSAFLVSELAHLRNVFRHSKIALRLLRLQNVRPTNVHNIPYPSSIPMPPLAQNERTNPTNHRNASRAFAVSLYVLIITIALFTADVLAVVFTQQQPKFSSSTQYNVRAFQPILPTVGISKYIRRLAGDRPCVSPFLITNTTQMRKYHLLTCMLIDFGGTTNPGDYDLATNVSITSFFHRGGADHRIEFGAGFITVSTRAQVILNRIDGGARRLLYTNLDDESFTFTKYIHELTVFGAKDWICRRKGDIYTEWCNNNSALASVSSVQSITQEIYLWRAKNRSIYENVTGIVSTFTGINLLNATGSFNSAVRSLISTGYVLEVKGHGSYERINDDQFEDGIPKLLGESSRVTGVIMLSVVVSVFVVLMFILRCLLRPISLGDMVLQNIDQNSGLESLERTFQQDLNLNDQTLNADPAEDAEIGTGSLNYTYDAKDDHLLTDLQQQVGQMNQQHNQRQQPELNEQDSGPLISLRNQFTRK